MANDEDIETIGQVLRLHPGDRVILTVRDGYANDSGTLQRMNDHLREKWADVEFLVVAGVDISAVIHAQ